MLVLAAAFLALAFPAAGASSLSPGDHRRVVKVGRWTEADGCKQPPAVTREAAADDDGTRVERTTYASCAGGVEVVLVAIEGGGHQWPGTRAGPGALGRTSRHLSASDVIWDFFRRHPQP